jgi:hypothetical protein
VSGAEIAWWDVEESGMELRRYTGYLGDVHGVECRNCRSTHVGCEGDYSKESGHKERVR